MQKKENIQKKQFKYDKNNFFYYIHKHNSTFYNERAIELPIILEYYNNHDPEHILEVGDVLSHYISPKHTIIDKFETNSHVLTADAITYSPSKKFKLIVSISTIEHIGWDDDPFKPELVLDAIINLKKLLTSDGLLIVTAPIGYNSFLDKKIAKNDLGLDKQLFFTRDKNNKWTETAIDISITKKYGQPYPSANALFIGIIDNSIIEKT